jgi:steroid delta-isomerase-like uncharacterized protein
MEREYESFLYRWFEEVWNAGSEESLDEMLHDDVYAHGLTDERGEIVRGKEEFRKFFRNFRAALSDINVEVGEVIRDGDKISAVTHVKAVHAGPELGFPASNNKVEFSGILMVRLKDDRIVEAWNYYDFVKMFAQMGVLAIQPPEAAANK